VPPPPPSSAEATPPPAPAAKMTTAEAAKATLPSYFEALNQHDAKRYAGFFAEDGVLTLPGAAPKKGRAEIAAGVQHLFDAISSLKIAPTRVLVKGDVVAVEWAMVGTHSGDYLGVKATEKPVGVSGVTVLVFDPDSGLVKEAHRYADDATILSQIGASKAKTRAIPTLSSSPEWRTAAGTPNEERGEAAWRRALAAINEKNETDYIAQHQDDVAYDDMTQPLGMRGQSEARKWLKEFQTQMPDAKIDASGVWGIEDYVVSELTIRGTSKTAKKEIVLHTVDVLQMKDGKVAHGWSYGDGRELATQLAPPTPATKAGAAAPKKK
jgi:steroid delta-isomerase-like uncharacterized protein